MGFAIIAGVVLGILIDMMQVRNVPIVYVAEAKEAVVKEDAPQIVIKIDWTKERIEKEIRTAFPEEPNTAVAIAWAESQLNPNAYNGEAHRGCNGSLGIMQMACVHQRGGEDLFDPAVNIKRARNIYDDSKARTGNGWLPWGAYTDGRWKQYLWCATL